MRAPWPLRTTAPDLAALYRDAGLWTDDTLGQLLFAGLGHNADRDFRVWSRSRPYEATIGEVFDASRRFATHLITERGVRPGDVVAFQLPNCPEAAIVFWGAAFAGAVLVPIVHFYGPHEVGFILEQASPDVVIIGDRFGPFDFAATFEAASDRWTRRGDDREIVIQLTGPPLATPGLLDAVPLDAPVAADPDQPALIAYTSGTTADPKGVIHTHRSIVAEIRQLGDIQPDDDRPMLAGAPVGHAIGMLTGLLLPVYRDKAIHLIDTWDPAMILDAMVEADITAGSGATYFLTSLLDAPGFGPSHVERMPHIGLGGSSVPESVANRAIALGISVARSYGSTEHPSTTGAAHAEPQAPRKKTDGHPLSGVEIRIVDDHGIDAAIGTPGEILTRGPELCAGYTDPALTAESFDDEGWYHSGDVGIVDADGWLTITDRTKDIIIRGGENISAVEVESLMLGLPGIAEVAVVAAPDHRLGEHACAFVRAGGTPAPSLDDVQRHLADLGLAKQKWPEELRIVDDLPRTPSGKVKKFELRDLLRREADG